MDFFNDLPLYVWILVTAIIIILIVLFVFILNRRAKEAQELDAMFEPAWDDENEERVDRATIQRRRREERARRQKEVESRRDRETRRTKNQREKKENDSPSVMQAEEGPQDIVNKGFSNEEEHKISSQNLDSQGDEPLQSVSLRNKLPIKEEAEPEELTHDASLDRLGGLPPLGRWQQKKEEVPAEIEREAASEKEPRHLGSLPPRGRAGFLESEGTSKPEEEKPLHRRDLPQLRATRSSLEDTGLRRLGGLPPLDTSRFQKQAEKEPSTPEQGLAGEEKESPYWPTLSEETTDESSIKQQDFQSFAGGLPSRATTEAEEPVSGATSQAESEEEEEMFLRRSRFLSDKKSEGIPEGKQRGASPLGTTLPPRRASYPEAQGTEEIFETREREEGEDQPKRMHLRRSPISRMKEMEVPSISEDEKPSFDESLSPRRAFSSEEAALGTRGREEAREDSGLQRRYLRRSLVPRKEEAEESAPQESSVPPIGESLLTRRASQFEANEIAPSLETREQKEMIEGSEQKRILRRSSNTRKEEVTTSSTQEQDFSGNPSFSRRRAPEDELQQRVSTSSSEPQPDFEEKQESFPPETAQGLGPRSRRQKSRWKRPWGKKE